MLYRNRLATIGLMLVVLVIGILTQPVMQYHLGDAYVLREEARAIVLHGGLSLDEEVAKTFTSRGAFFVLNMANGRYYSRYGSVSGLINAIPMAAEKLITGELPPLESPHRVLILGIFFAALSAAIAGVLFIITGYYTTHLPTRFCFVVLACYTTYLWNYLRSTTSESTQLLLFALFFLFFLRFERRAEPLPARPRRDLYLAWSMLLLLCQTKISYLAFIPLFVATLCWLGTKSSLSGASLKRYVARDMLLPILVIGAAQGIMQYIKFGSPFLSGYHQYRDPYFPHTFLEATLDFLWSWQGSIFVHFPLLLLAGFGLRRFLRNHKLDAALPFGAFFITYLLVAPEGGAWRGELAYGPRYFVIFLPFMALPALYPLQWMLAQRGKAQAAALIATAAAAVFLAAAQMQVNRMNFFFRYDVAISPARENNEVRDDPHAPAEMNYYFSHTNFAKINWDHLRASGDWEKLPYYSSLRERLSPQSLLVWQKFIMTETSLSNLYWFPGFNR